MTAIVLFSMLFKGKQSLFMASLRRLRFKLEKAKSAGKIQRPQTEAAL